VSFPEILTPTFGQWTKHIIDSEMYTAVSIDVADLDGDSYLDYVVTDARHNSLNWYQNKYPSWIKRTIDTSASLVIFADWCDIDGDDTIDVVAHMWGSKKLVWYERKPSSWIQHMIDGNTSTGDFMMVADINGDGKPDAITSCGPNGGDIVWYENQHPIWIKRNIATGAIGHIAEVEIVDIDADGHMDVVATFTGENKVVWYKTEDEGVSWSMHFIDPYLKNAFGLNCGDINGDGTADIVVSTGGPYYEGSKVVWYENHYPNWTKHVIDTDLPGAAGISITDVDGDERTDIIVGGYEVNDIVWYENNHPTWSKYVIDNNMIGPRQLIHSDIDGDNASDIIVAGEENLVWYKNPHSIVAQVDTLEVYPRYISPQTGDTLKIMAHVSNPENHQATVHAFIQGENSALKDSVQLFDDGLHDDGIASENIYGGTKLVDDLDEDYFDISIRTTDSNDSVTTYYSGEGHFTTIGPLFIDHYEIFDQGQDMGQLDYFKLKVFLKNNGSIAPAIEVRADLSTTDTNIGIMTGSSLHFNNIDPGQIKFNDSEIRVYTKNDPDSVKIDVSIFSKNILYWSDTITINLVPVGVTYSIPTGFELFQCFPNPFSNSTNISYSMASSGFVILTVFDLYGREIQTIVNEFQKPDTYTVEFDPGKLSNGIYFCRLQLGSDFVKTRKMLYSR